MEDQEKSKEILIKEINDLRYRLAELEASETRHRQIEETLSQNLEKLRKTTEFIVDVIVMAVEAKDPYMAGHQKRVAELARAIAVEMGLSSEIVDGIRMAGLIHDLGKISVPAEILGKPSELNHVEYDLIKTHPENGYNMLKNIDFNRPVPLMVLQHHERTNGTGYPHGLKGEEIIPEARILGVADVVEAICVHRPYRPAYGIDRALKEIMEFRGILYDPQAVDACVGLFREKGFKFK